MNTGQYALVNTVAFALSFCVPSATFSESLALVLTNSNYRDYDNAEGVADRRALVDLFEDAGFRSLGAQNLSAAALRQAAMDLQDAVKGGAVDRVAIVLSGHFVAGANDSWLLGGDASDLSALTAGVAGVSVSALSGLAGAFPGQALVVLVPARGEDLPDGYGLSPGIGTFEVPQGVTVARGTADAIREWIGTTMLTPGISLADAADSTTDEVNVTGFLSGRISFIDTAVAPAPARPAPARPAPVVPGSVAELAFWNAARDIGTEAAFERYMQRYPQGRFAAEAQARIADIRDAPRQRAEAGEAALALNRDARRDVQRDLSLLGFNPRGIDGVFGPGSRAAISAHQRSLGLPETSFLSAEQLRILRRDAATRAMELEREAKERSEREAAQDRAYWDSIGRGRDEAGLRTYLQRYPDGQFADLAQQRLDQIDAERRRQAAAEERNKWDEARRQDTPAAYRQFLSEFPNGAFAEDARARLTGVEADNDNKAAIDTARAEEAQVAGSQVARVLLEQRLSQLGLDPGVVDGTFDAATRRAIRRFQRSADLPVTGFVTQQTMVRLLASGLVRRE